MMDQQASSNQSLRAIVVDVRERALTVRRMAASLKSELRGAEIKKDENPKRSGPPSLTFDLESAMESLVEAERALNFILTDVTNLEDQKRRAELEAKRNIEYAGMKNDNKVYPQER